MILKTELLAGEIARDSFFVPISFAAVSFSFSASL